MVKHKIMLSPCFEPSVVIDQNQYPNLLAMDLTSEISKQVSNANACWQKLITGCVEATVHVVEMGKSNTLH